MKDELRLLRKAHEEQGKRVLAERVVAADRIRALELRIEQLESEAADVLEDARRHLETSRDIAEVARAERDAALRQLEDLRGTPTYRLVTLVHDVLAPRRGRAR
jgi:hypothetical protein